MLLSDVDTWNVGALQSIAFELGDELKTIEGVAGDLELISRLPGWDSPAADAARGKIHSTTGKVLDDAAAIGAVQQLAEEASAAVAKLQSDLAAVRADVAAQGGFLQLAGNGDVTITGPPDIREELQPIADNIEARAKALIHQAEDIDADCAEVFGNLEHGDITARGATDFATAQEMGRDQSGLSAPYPPEGEEVTPQNVNAWWDALSDKEQQKVIAEHPDWIANRDGVPVPARHQANIPVLERELADVQRQLDALGSREDFIRSHPEMDPAQAAAVYAKRVGELQPRFDNAKAMKEALSLEGDPSKGYDPNKYLMLLKFPDGREPRAAIAVGNPDDAEHVSVTTPGVGTNPTSLPDMVEEARVLRDETRYQLDIAGRTGEEVSTIAWLGYEPPDKADISIVEAGFDRRANEAAPDLAEFYRSINATNEHGSDVHLSAFGHSYGSLTTAQALNELGATGVVDDAAFYGSPGLGYTNETWTDRSIGIPIERPYVIDDESDLFLADGHAFVMSAPEDPISGDPNVLGIPMPSAGDLGQFGPNPLTLPLEQLSTEAAVTPTDNVPRDGAYRHADYPRMGGNGELRTTGYFLAIIAADLADVPTDDGKDRLVR